MFKSFKAMFKLLAQCEAKNYFGKHYLLPRQISHFVEIHVAFTRYNADPISSILLKHNTIPFLT